MNDIKNSVAMVITTLIMQKFNLNMMFYSVLLPILLYILNLNYDILYDYIHLWYLILVPISLLIIYYYELHNNIHKLQFWKRESCISIYDKQMLSIFNDYIALYKDIYIGSKFVVCGDLDIMHMQKSDKMAAFYGDINGNPMVINDPYNIHNFYDTNLQVKGTIQWRKCIKKTEAKTNLKDKQSDKVETTWVHVYPFIKINMGFSKCNAIEYYKKIEEHMQEYEKTNIVLRYVKLLRVNKYNTDTTKDIEYNNHNVVFYEGKKQCLEEKEKKFINSFFHVKRDSIWTTIKKIHYEPEFFHELGQNPRMNILLHGPPGSGKSSLIYRIARCLDRHIVSLDISTINAKKVLYQVIQRPYINDKIMKPQDVIIVLEEFDIAIKKLHILETEDKFRKEKMNDILKKIIKNKETLLNDSESKSLINDKIFDEDHDKIYLRDLLDILQGTIPVDGSLIIATSNKYEEIKDFCPELFRNGRMTPIYFGYLDLQNFKDLCKHYFNKLPSLELCQQMFEQVSTNIKTSCIIEKALEYKLQHGDKAFELFQNALKEEFI